MIAMRVRQMTGPKRKLDVVKWFFRTSEGGSSGKIDFFRFPITGLEKGLLANVPKEVASRRRNLVTISIHWLQISPRCLPHGFWWQAEPVGSMLFQTST
ncbi:hypothetical protein A3753_18465 [Sulfitobacter sp. HI0082]|nr:hypothetical protein A3753_21740 [Sulfitobacter sp. HI0082]KZZ23875.1 hypothetical protein A3753_18465 [Sulfitobacter sp. HI0082]